MGDNVVAETGANLAPLHIERSAFRGSGTTHALFVAAGVTGNVEIVDSTFEQVGLAVFSSVGVELLRNEIGLVNNSIFDFSPSGGAGVTLTVTNNHLFSSTGTFNTALSLDRGTGTDGTCVP